MTRSFSRRDLANAVISIKVAFGRILVGMNDSDLEIFRFIVPLVNSVIDETFLSCTLFSIVVDFLKFADYGRVVVCLPKTFQYVLNVQTVLFFNMEESVIDIERNFHCFQCLKMIVV